MKAAKVFRSVGPGVPSMWAFGFALVLLSLYATTMLPPLGDPIAIDPGAGTPSLPIIAIFSVPCPFIGPAGERQGLAIRSWLGLSPQVTVVLFTRDSSVAAFAGTLSSRVVVEPGVDFSFLGTPFFHSMVARSQKFVSDIAIFVDAETVILPDFISALNFVHGVNHTWFLFGSTCNVSHIPFRLDNEGKHWLRESGKRVKVEEMQEVLGQCRMRSHLENRMLIAWNRVDMPLHHGILPPFFYGKGKHNAWLINEEQPLTSVELEINERGWESTANVLVGTTYGSSAFHGAKNSSLLRLLKCNKTFLFVNRNYDIVRISERDNILAFLEKRILHLWGNKNRVSCAEDCIDTGNAVSWPLKDEEPASIHFPFSLKSLLATLADNNNTIILGVAGYSYKDMLMSWVCRLRALRLTNFIVCALDPETFEFSLLQGLPVFKDQSVPNGISFDDCHFGTECFQKVTKVKSRIVLKILKLGYNVLMSDVDVYWFRNPLPYISSFGPAVLVAQSDEYNETGPINMPRRLNSGFYFAHSDASTVAAMEKIIKHAATSGLSEQPSFYDTLCGEGGTNRLRDDSCVEPETNLTVNFLDRNLFPNGAYEGLWEETDVKESCLKKGCYILHNNWISGRQRKLERQVASCLGFDGAREGLRIPSSVGHFHVHYWIKACDHRSLSISRSEMLMRCVDLFGAASNRESAKRKAIGGGSPASVDISSQFKEFSLNSQSASASVKVIHVGGRVETYLTAFPASTIMEKFPGMCVARPDVFRRPHECILSADEMLLLGHKYFLLPCSTAKKLKHKHQEKAEPKEAVLGREKLPEKTVVAEVEVKAVADEGDQTGETAPCSANDFFVSNERWLRYSLRQKASKRKPFVPPMPRRRMLRQPAWEPSLSSVQELSP